MLVWDRLTSEEATLLTAAHLASPIHPDIPKTALLGLYPQTVPPYDHPWPKNLPPGSSTCHMNKGSWVFEDQNASTHLIRNALMGGDRDLRRKVLSCKPPQARQMRDDITALYVSLDIFAAGC